jgi:hypothetical protein
MTGIRALKLVKKFESRLAVSRRAVLAGSGSAALALLTGSAAASSHTQDTSDQQSDHKLEIMGRYESEIFDGGAVEIASYVPTTQQVLWSTRMRDKQMCLTSRILQRQQRVVVLIRETTFLDSVSGASIALIHTAIQWHLPLKLIAQPVMDAWHFMMQLEQTISWGVLLPVHYQI